jgi:hypothetical protein
VLVRLDREDAPTNEQAAALLRVPGPLRHPKQVGRAFSGAAVELALASYPGFTLTSQPGGRHARTASTGRRWSTRTRSSTWWCTPTAAREVVPHTPPCRADHGALPAAHAQR